MDYPLISIHCYRNSEVQLAEDMHDSRLLDLLLGQDDDFRCCARNGTNLSASRVKLLGAMIGTAMSQNVLKRLFSFCLLLE